MLGNGVQLPTTYNWTPNLPLFFCQIKTPSWYSSYDKLSKKFPYVFQEVLVLKQNFEIFQNTLLSDHEEGTFYPKPYFCGFLDFHAVPGKQSCYTVQKGIH